MWNFFKVSGKDTQRRQWRHCIVVIINFEQILSIVLLFLLLTLNSKYRLSYIGNKITWGDRIK